MSGSYVVGNKTIISDGTLHQFHRKKMLTCEDNILGAAHRVSAHGGFMVGTQLRPEASVSEDIYEWLK